jgi:hypothetical protein
MTEGNIVEMTRAINNPQLWKAASESCFGKLLQKAASESCFRKLLRKAASESCFGKLAVM